MDEKTVRMLANIRGQHVVLVKFDHWHYLLTDKPKSKIDYLMSSLNTYSWENYSNDKWNVYDKNGKLLKNSQSYEWEKLFPLFVKKGAFKKAFFFHYNKPKSKELKKVQISLHYDKTCYTVDNIVCDVPTKGRIAKTQPYWVMTGKAKDISIENNVAYII